MNYLSKLLSGIIFLALSIGATIPAHAILIDRGGGLIYDTDLDITWLQDAGLANITGSQTGGRMTWGNAVNWAENLSYVDSVRNITWTDWRLPSTLLPDPSCSGFSSFGFSGGKNCIGSEMGHLYYTELGNPNGALNTGPFTISDRTDYWSGTSDSSNSNIAFSFSFYEFGGGGQNAFLKDFQEFGAWAVRDGDVMQNPVPEPSTLLLFGSGLAGIILWKRRKH